ncbi:MAG: glycosyltransferase family 39 protein [bacterium]|nr:glycosyltransferase family 39 protein [Candidatus Margulisiibacteriota bacterium]
MKNEGNNNYNNVPKAHQHSSFFTLHSSLIILIIASFCLYFFKLGSFSLYDAAETTYGEFIKQIMLTGDWITMHYNGQIMFDKPPLYFWLARVFTIIIGFNEWAIRLPAAIFGVLTVITTFLLGKVFYDKRVGFLSALVLMTAFQFLIQSRIAELDVLLVFFITAGLYCFWQGKYKLMYLWMALGTLIKGIIAIAMPGLAIFLFLLITNVAQAFRPANSTSRPKGLHCFFKELQIVPGILIILAIGGPWYAAEWILHGEKFTQFVLGFLFLARFQDVVSGHPGPWYYYFPALLLGFFPWSHFIPYAFIRTWRNKLNKPELLTLCYIIPVFIVFSVAKTKLPNYILPIYPFLAIMVGKLWIDFLEERNLRLNVSVPFAGNRGVQPQVSQNPMLISNLGLLIVVILVFIAAVIAGRQYSGPYEALLPQLQLLGTIIGVGSLLSIFFSFSKNKRMSFAILPVMVFMMTAVLTTKTLPAIEEYKGTKELAQKVTEVIKPNEQIAAYHVGNRPGIVFYNSKPVVYLETEQKLAAFLQAKKGYCFTTVGKVEEAKGKLKVWKAKGDLAIIH